MNLKDVVKNMKNSITRRSEEPVQDVMQDTVRPREDQAVSNFRQTTGDAVGSEKVLKALTILQKYKEGKQALERRIVSNEQWWKGRHWEQIDAKEGTSTQGTKPNSAWLFNSIVSKHADYLDAYPEPNILPRELNDEEEAKRLSSIVPVVLEQCGFEKVYNEECWKKLKAGLGVYGVFWDDAKYNGLGDISINNIDLLNLFWEPGIADIQDSANIFHVNLVSNEVLVQRYPELEGKLGGDNTSLTTKYLYDENISTSDKTAVIDWYYHTEENGRKVLQYCKFVNDVVLYATENDIERQVEEVTDVLRDEAGNEMLDENGNAIETIKRVEIEGTSVAEKGLYDHGLYPFVCDNLFPVEGSIGGFGYIDIGKEAQEYIDKIDKALLENTQYGAKPRWLIKGDGQINETELKDTTKQTVHFTGPMDQDSLIPMPTLQLNGNYISMLQQKIQELKETTGNTDVAQGIPTGVTSGSAISALQEAAGKTSRAENKVAYGAYKEVVNMVIELIRQHYDFPRQFRITGEDGQGEFVDYDNTNIKPQHQGEDFGRDMGYRLPVFDIEVTAQKQNPYSKNGQNETVMSLYNMGVFNPEFGDQAVALVESMDFNQKQDVLNRIKGNSMLLQQNEMLKQQLFETARQLDAETGGNMAQDLAMAFGMDPGQPIPQGDEEVSLDEDKDHPFNQRAREMAQESTQPQ